MPLSSVWPTLPTTTLPGGVTSNSMDGDTEYRSERIQPIDSVRVRLQIPAGRPVRQLRRLWQKADIPFEIVGTEIGFTVENPGEYEVVVAEF